MGHGAQFHSVEHLLPSVTVSQESTIPVLSRRSDPEHSHSRILQLVLAASLRWQRVGRCNVAQDLLSVWSLSYPLAVVHQPCIPSFPTRTLLSVCSWWFAPSELVCPSAGALPHCQGCISCSLPLSACS